jgi:hypothetical protein
MASLKGLASIVSELRVERTNLVNQLNRVETALSVLGKSNGGSFHAKLGRTRSASARKRMSLAQKERWAKRAAHDQAGKMKPKRTLSASARRKIAAAQRARWAKVRAKKAA